MADVRIYCSEEYKRTVKIEAAKQGLSISDLLKEIIQKAIPSDNDINNLINEMEKINLTLANKGGCMTANERNKLKERRNIIKELIRKENV